MYKPTRTITLLVLVGFSVQLDLGYSWQPDIGRPDIKFAHLKSFASDVDYTIGKATLASITGKANLQVQKLTRENLELLPILSVPQKRSATFECSIEQKYEVTQLVWKKLKLSDRGQEESSNKDEILGNDLILLSHNERMISKDPRLKVSRVSPWKWLLFIDNVAQSDDRAFYLCQASLNSSHHPSGFPISNSNASSFSGGAQLHVLMPPRIDENETSSSWLQVQEYDQLILRCKVISEPQASVVWRREDGKSSSLQYGEQRFLHHIERKPGSKIISHDIAELQFNSSHRDIAGAYLCVASNGVHGGVSHRVNVDVVNCRSSPDKELAEPEACETRSSNSKTIKTTTTSTTTTTTTTTTTIPPSTASPMIPQSGHRSKLTVPYWRTSGSHVHQSSSSSPQSSSSSSSSSSKLHQIRHNNGPRYQQHKQDSDKRLANGQFEANGVSVMSSSIKANQSKQADSSRRASSGSGGCLQQSSLFVLWSMLLANIFLLLVKHIPNEHTPL